MSYFQHKTQFSIDEKLGGVFKLTVPFENAMEISNLIRKLKEAEQHYLDMIEAMKKQNFNENNIQFVPRFIKINDDMFNEEIACAFEQFELFLKR